MKIATASAAAIHGGIVRSVRRVAGSINASSAIDPPRSAAVYFDSSARPSATPASGQPARRPRNAAASARRASDQNAAAGASGLTTSDPACESGSAHASSAVAVAARPARSGGARSAAHPASAAATTNPQSNAGNRTAISPSPNRRVDAAIIHATIGG